MNFIETLQAHLYAIQSRDFELYVSTLSEQEELTLLTLSGQMTLWRVDFVETMKGWLADPDWKIKFEVIRAYETAEMGFALLYVNYDDVDGEGTPYHLDYFLNLIFAQENGSWRLVHDQNTFADAVGIEAEAVESI